MPDGKDISVSLPEALRKKFAELEARLWSLETVAAVAFGLGALGVSYLLLFISDRLWNTPVWLRVALAATGWAGLAWAALRWLHRWVLHRRDLRDLSLMVQNRFRRLGDRLLGIVELANEKDRPAYYSPGLYRAAIQQVSEEAGHYEFREAIRARSSKTCGVLLAVLALILAGPAFLVPTASWNAFCRWLMPAAKIPRYTLVQLAELPSAVIVPHGESFEIECVVQYRSFWRPLRGAGQFERQPPVTGAVNAERLRLRLPGQVQPGVLRLRVGDGAGEVAIQPAHRPSLKQLTASIALPDYLQYEPFETAVQGGTLHVLEGSRVAFQGQISRALKDAALRVDEASQGLAVRGETFHTEPMKLDTVFECAFTWRDDLGLDSPAPWRLTIQTQKDAAPQPEIQDLTREFAMLESEVLPLRTVARDDYGVKELGLKWEVIGEFQPTNGPPAPGFLMNAPSPQEKTLETVFRFSPALLRVPADSTVELQALAKDYYPGREASESAIYRVIVLGNATHAESVRQRLESLLARLEEVTRLEEKVEAAASEMAALSEEELRAEPTDEKIRDAEGDQARNAAQLEELAKEGMKLWREAVRNPTFEEGTLQDWAQNVQAMQELSQSEMQEASRALKAAEKNPDSRKASLAEAQAKAEDILETLQQMQSQINRGLDDLQALTLAQRLRKVSKEENGIGTELRKHIPETIGLLARDLPDRYQRTNAMLASHQNDNQQESDALQGEISRFYERTQKEDYGEVSREMKEAKTVDELEKVKNLIHENIAMEAMLQLSAWSQRFSNWADKLERKQSSSAGGGGGGEGAPDEMAYRLLEQLMVLLRLREGEYNVREQTQLLEQQRERLDDYGQAADALYFAQRDLLKNLVRLQSDNPFEPLVDPLKEVYEAMQDAGTLLGRPQTDSTTVQAQTKTIDVLSDVINLINEQTQSGSSEQSAMSEEMAFLMQMMALQAGQSLGMTPGPQPGGSQAGGTTDAPATPHAGDAQGKEAESRSVRKASGVIENLPAEFRDALESYFNGIEQSAP